MNVVQRNEYLVSTAGTDGHQGISSYSAKYAASYLWVNS